MLKKGIKIIRLGSGMGQGYGQQQVSKAKSLAILKCLPYNKNFSGWENRMGKEKSFSRRIASSINFLLWLAFLFTLVVVFTPLTQYMLRPFQVEEELRQADVIVVIPGGIDSGFYLQHDSARRLMRGVQLYHAGWSSKIYFPGGRSSKNNISEAMVMAQEARRLKVPSEDILLDSQSPRLVEQARKCKKIVRSLGGESLLLVTSYLQMKRTLLVFENLGFKVYPASADPCEKYVDDPLGRLALFPKLLQEYVNLIYYKIRGWV
jgi:uncharacterized SAM-binding protein YcdF (DUF218 family)